MPFGSLGVRGPAVVDQAIPNYAQWDWDMAGKGMKAMEAGYKIGQDSQNQPIARENAELTNDKISLDNELNAALFPTKLNAATLELEKIKASTNQMNAHASYYTGMLQYSNNLGNLGSDFYAKNRQILGLNLLPSLTRGTGNAFYTNSALTTGGY